MREQRTGSPIQVGDVTITPVFEIDLDAVAGRPGIYVWGSVEPVAVLIRRNGREERVEVFELPDGQMVP